MKMEWDDGSYEGAVTLISIGNAPLTGGVFYTVPHADPFDGKLSAIYGHISTRLKILTALPKIMRKNKGNIAEHPAVQPINCTWLKVTTEPPTPAHADGEIFETSISALEYKIHPAQLPIITGN
jgi:diacylglycerol kinase family enzyme